MNNRLFGLNRSKVCRVLRIAVVICWWGSTLPFICHILAGFTTPLYPESYRYTLIPYPVAFRIAAAGYWLSQIALFYGCGVAVLKSNIRLLRFFCLAAIVPQIPITKKITANALGIRIVPRVIAYPRKKYSE